MANPEQERLLRQNVNVWNSWRESCLEIPDLSHVVFRELDPTNANLSHVNLQGAEFHDCLVSSASFESAQLQDAKFNSIRCSDQVNFLYAKMCRSRMTNCKWRNSLFNSPNPIINAFLPPMNSCQLPTFLTRRRALTGIFTHPTGYASGHVRSMPEANDW
jgi:hypothetical protein